MFEINKNKKYTIIAVIVLLLAIIVISFMYLSDKPTEVIDIPVEEAITPTIPEDSTPEVVIEEKQCNAMSIIKAKVLSIINNTSTIQYTVSMGVDEKTTESKIVSNSNTIVYDAALERVVGVNGVKENMEVMFYVVGNYKVGNLVASAMVIGGTNDIKFGSLTEIYKENDELYVGKILDTTNYINISKDTLIENGYTGMDITDLNTIKPNSLILYYVEPDFKQTKDGLFFDTNKIVVVRDGEKK